MGFPADFKNTSALLLDSMDHTRRAEIGFFFVSLILHGLFFGGLILFQDFKGPKPLPPVIQVDLVSFAPEPAFEAPAKSSDSPTDGAVPIKPAPIKKKSRKIPTIKADISLKTKPKNLKDLIAEQEKKKKEPEKKIVEQKEEKKPVLEEKDTTDPEKPLEDGPDEANEPEKPENKVEDPARDKIADALSRLQERVKEQGDKRQNQGKTNRAGTGKKGYKPIDLYKMVLGQTIEQNWVFNDILAGMDQRLEVRILIKILKSGEIRDIIYETKSGNRYLDESAKKAIKKTNPLPQLPAGMHSYDVVVIFTPRGLK
jgi:TonB family protein